jgi:hypothetical protein
MKVQFASTEALLSLFLAVAMLSFSAYSLNRLIFSSRESLGQISSGMASYDFIAQFLGNSSERECVYLKGPSSCKIPYGFYMEVYGLRKFKAVQLYNASPGDYALRCFTYPADNAIGYICIEAG